MQSKSRLYKNGVEITLIDAFVNWVPARLFPEE